MRVVLDYGYSCRVFRPVDDQRMPARVLDRASPIERQLLGETVSHQGYFVRTETMRRCGDGSRRTSVIWRIAVDWSAWGPSR